MRNRVFNNIITCVNIFLSIIPVIFITYLFRIRGMCSLGGVKEACNITITDYLGGKDQSIDFIKIIITLILMGIASGLIISFYQKEND